MRSDSGSLQDAATPNDGMVKHESDSSLEERRRRKREQDRLCQRRKREKDRDNLRRLEARLSGLQTADESKTVLDLILRHEEDQAKIDRQVDRLRQLQSLLAAGLHDLGKDASALTDDKQSVLLEIKDASDDSPDMREILDSVPYGAQHFVQLQSSVKPTLATTTETPLLFDATSVPIASYNPSYAFDETSGSFMAGSGTDLTVPPYGRPRATTGPLVADVNTPWLAAANLVETACKAAQHVKSATTTDAVDQHIILSICLSGWECASTAFNMTNPLWTCLRQCDDATLIAWPRLERMLALYMMWRVLKATAQGPEAVAKLTPAFLRPRPSQLNIPHRADIDYYPWPGFRERLVFHCNKYYSQEVFFQDFHDSKCFLWPYNFADTFFQSKETQLLQFSPELLKRFNNINCWTVDSGFLVRYPEFVGDLPTYNSIPARIEDKGSDEQNFYLQDESLGQLQPSQGVLPQTWAYPDINAFVGYSGNR